MTTTIRVRTVEEITARLRQGADDVFGWRFEVLVRYLTAEQVQEFTPGVDLSAWVIAPLHAEPIAEEVRSYMAFAWGKVEDHRGLSAGRSVEKIGAWLWVLGLDDMLAAMTAAEYQNYGAPQLAVVCRLLNLPIPPGEWAQRMIASLPCQPGCDEGCCAL